MPRETILETVDVTWLRQMGYDFQGFVTDHDCSQRRNPHRLRSSQGRLDQAELGLGFRHVPQGLSLCPCPVASQVLGELELVAQAA